MSVTIVSFGLPRELAEPRMSDALKAKCRDIMAWEGRREDKYSAEIQAEAREAIAEIARLRRGPSPEHLAAWLEPIILGTRTTRTESAMKGWLDAVGLMCADVPASAFNQKTQIKALETITFFPGTADIFGVVSEERGRLITLQLALQQILWAGTV